MGAAKAGHVGSLDPLATGMLPICLGEATKVAGDIPPGASAISSALGLAPARRPAMPRARSSRAQPVPPLQVAEIERVLQGFRGRQSQVPPMYSALKRDGQPLYNLARAGQVVERAARDIDISELKILSFDGAALELEGVCSKGTYIRILAEDIARALGTCGYVTRLHRAYVEPFTSEPMHSLESIASACAAGDAPELLPADLGVGHLPAVHLDALRAQRLRQGQAVAGEARVSGRVRLYDEAGRFIGMGEANGQGEVRPRRLFVL